MFETFICDFHSASSSSLYSIVNVDGDVREFILDNFFLWENILKMIVLTG